jgi:hypothetical protein
VDLKSVGGFMAVEVGAVYEREGRAVGYGETEEV